MAAVRRIFHVSIPVADLDSARRFYETTFGARSGRVEAEWADILIWGHQVTLQRQPDAVLPVAAQGKRHFGVVLPWEEWEALAARLRAAGTDFLGAPAVLNEATPEEQAKFYLEDPSHNVIEVKAYRNFAHVLGTDDDGYNQSET